MRIPRSLQLLSPQGFIHQFWRCHNKEFYLRPSRIKSLYLNCLKRALRSHNQEGCLKIYAYTVMDNHFHNLMDYRAGSPALSNFLRQAHSLFGAAYNRIYNRTGKVAEGRPRTSLIENLEHLMRVHFYIEANPLRAAKCTLKQLKFFKHSSYRFYAHGITDEFSEILTVPDWYVRLGASKTQRQYRYRRLFQEYLGESPQDFEMFAPFIGTILWQFTSKQRIKTSLKVLRESRDFIKEDYSSS